MYIQASRVQRRPVRKTRAVAAGVSLLPLFLLTYACLESAATFAASQMLRTIGVAP